MANQYYQENCGETILVMLSILVLIIFFPFSLIFCFSIVKEYKRAVIFRTGRIKSRRPLGPGMIFVLRCIERVRIVDMRLTMLRIPTQSVVTKDSVSVDVESIVYYRVLDPVTLCTALKESKYELIIWSALKGICVTTVRNVAIARTLYQIVSERGPVCATIKMSINKVTTGWGINVQRVEIFDVKITDELASSMAATANAFKEAKAKKVNAEAELKVAKALKEASDQMVQSPMSLQLKYLETMSNIAGDRETTVLFPVPMDIFLGSPQKTLPKTPPKTPPKTVQRTPPRTPPKTPPKTSVKGGCHCDK